MSNFKKSILALIAVSILSTAAYAGTSIWGSTDRGPVLGTYRIPVDTSSASSPGYITPAELATYVGSGGSVSISSVSPGLTVSPNPITGTGTIGETALISSTCGSSTTCTILSTDMGMIVENSSASSMAVSLPQCNNGSFTVGSSYNEINIGTGTATITAAGGSLINGSPTSTTTLALTPNQGAQLTCDAAGNWNAFLGGAPLPALAANQVLGSLTAVAPTGLSVPSCSGAANALIWTSGTGFGCNTIAGSGTINNGVSGQMALYNGTNAITGDAAFTDNGTTIASSEPMAITSASATALSVGRQGATNPVLNVDASTASVLTGITVKGAATGGTTSITATDSGSNTGISVNAKGTGNATLAAPSSGNAVVSTVSGNIQFSVNASNVGVISNSGTWSLSPNAAGSGVTAKIKLNGINDASLTASTEAPMVWFNDVAQVRQHATGSLALNRDFIVNAATYSFAGASTATDLAAIGWTSPGCGTNGTCTNVSGLYHASAALVATGTITNSYGFNIAADTGATNNYAGQTAGTLKVLPSATLPVVSSCGSGTLTTGSGDNKGSISGITAATACTLTFGVPLSAAPSCTFNSNAAIVPTISSISTTAVTTTMAALTGTLYYICF